MQHAGQLDYIRCTCNSSKRVFFVLHRSAWSCDSNSYTFAIKLKKGRVLGIEGRRTLALPLPSSLLLRPTREGKRWKQKQWES